MYSGRGDILGIENGPISSDINGNILGVVSGDIFGDINGNLYGVIKGDVNGNIFGHVFGVIVGNVRGDINGDVRGIIKGDVTGIIKGDVTGYVNEMQGGRGSLKPQKISYSTTKSDFNDKYGDEDYEEEEEDDDDDDDDDDDTLNLVKKYLKQSEIEELEATYKSHCARIKSMKVRDVKAEIAKLNSGFPRLYEIPTEGLGAALKENLTKYYYRVKEVNIENC